VKKSCLVQLILFGVLVVALAMGIKRFVGPKFSSLKMATPEKAAVSTQAGDAHPVPAEQQSSPTATLPVQRGIEGLVPQLRLSLPLPWPGARIQGLVVSEKYYYVAAQDGAQQKAFIYRMLRTQPGKGQLRVISQGPFFEVGNLVKGRQALWTAVASSEKNQTLLLMIDPVYLGTLRSFLVNDYITAVVETEDGHLYGFNDRLTTIYEWAPTGEEIRRKPFAGGGYYYDIAVVRGSLVCAGVDPQGGVLDVIDPGTLTLLVRHRCLGFSKDGQPLTSGGFDVQDGTFYFLVGLSNANELFSFGLKKDIPWPAYIPSARE